MILFLKGCKVAHERETRKGGILALLDTPNLRAKKCHKNMIMSCAGLGWLAAVVNGHQGPHRQNLDQM